MKKNIVEKNVKKIKEIEKPKQVKWAVNILYAFLGISFFINILGINNSSGNTQGAVHNSTIVYIILLLSLLIYYNIGKGKNWARILFTLGFLQMIFLLVSDFNTFLNLSAFEFYRSILMFLMGGTVCALLFQKPSNKYFNIK